MLLALIGFSLVAFRAPTAHAGCGDVVLAYSTMQMYAPATIQLTFAFTRDRDGDEKPFGFATQASVEKGTNFLKFHATENDTYLVWFRVRYDTPVSQNITLTTQEGSRPPVSLPICMTGQLIYITWQGISVVPEPKQIPISEYWNYGEQFLSAAAQASQDEHAAIQSNLTVLFAFDIVLLVAIVGNIVYTHKVRNWLKGRA